MATGSSRFAAAEVGNKDEVGCDKMHAQFTFDHVGEFAAQDVVDPGFMGQRTAFEGPGKSERLGCELPHDFLLRLHGQTMIG